MVNVPFFNYPDLYLRDKEKYNEIFENVCSKGAFILQNELAEFEARLAEFLNVRFALGMADGTNAISVGLQASGISSGDEIIISSHTYIATASAIRDVGAIPVLADIGEDNLLCPLSASAAITPRTKAIMPTQLNGRCANMDEFLSLAERHGLMVFEDSAQALGAKYKNLSAGTFGAFGTLSFYPAKTMGCFGDGGALITNDENVYKKAKMIRDHGRDDNGEFVMWGRNCRLDNLQAAFLVHRLSKISEDIERRRQIAKKYDDALSSNPNLYLPPKPSDGPHFDAFQNYELASEQRDALRSHLDKNGIKTLVQWGGKPLHDLVDLGFKPEQSPNLSRTNWFFDRCFMLPMNMSVSDEQVNHIIDTMLGFFKEN